MTPEAASGKAFMPAPKPRPTLREVAEHAGVGFKTVSRVVNAEPGVSPAMTAKVQASLDALGYIPHLGAGSLRSRSQRSYTIGLTISNVADPLAAQIHRGVEDVARSRGYATLAISVDEDVDVEAQALNTFLQRRVDGLILTPVAPSLQVIAQTLERGTPVVFVDREPVGIMAPSITVDNIGAAHEATSHLIRHGHQHIAFLAHAASIQTAQLRYEGFLGALEAAGLAVGNALFNISSEQQAFNATTALLRGEAIPRRFAGATGATGATGGAGAECRHLPTALFTAQNAITAGALRALHNLGLQRQVALIGFDDLPLAGLVEPGVSVIEQDLYLMGATAAEQLLAGVDVHGQDIPSIVIPTRLIARGSGEIMAPRELPPH